MRIHLLFAGLAIVGVGCTAFVAANLADTNGTVENHLGGCFQLADTTCGQCIANNCEDPSNATQPVSLKKICSLDQYNSVIDEARYCSTSSSIDDYNCEGLYVDGGTYAASIDDKQAAANNIRHCITDHCVTSCSRCVVDVPTCGSDTVDLLEAGTCGSCIDQAMNVPGAPCQSYVLQGTCSTYSSGAIAQCAIPSGSCQVADCSDLSAPDAGALAKCLWSQCGNGSCPSP